jgi:hypothetical protein
MADAWNGRDPEEGLDVRRFACILPTVLMMSGVPAAASVIEIPLLAPPMASGPAPAGPSGEIRVNNLFLLQNIGPLAGLDAASARDLRPPPKAAKDSTLFDIDLFGLDGSDPGTAIAPLALP